MSSQQLHSMIFYEQMLQRFKKENVNVLPSYYQNLIKITKINAKNR